MLRDFRYALRSLRRSPGFVAVAVLCLGLGLGITTTIAAMLDAVLRPEVPYRDPATLYRLIQWGWGAREQVDEWQKFTALRDGARFYEDIGYGVVGGATAEAGTLTRQIGVAWVSPNFFRLVGARAEQGRVLGSASFDEDSRGIVLSQALWRQMFAEHRTIEGAVLTVGGQAFDVLGVMQEGMDLPWGAQAWIQVRPGQERRGHMFPMLRVRQGADSLSIARDLRAIEARLTATFGTGKRPFEYTMSSLKPDPIGLRRYHQAMIGAGLGVLLIACANLANLMLARGLAQRREVVLRMALGASRASVVRQMLLEALAVSLAGGLLGVFLSLWGAGILTRHTPPNVAWVGIIEPQLSWRVFLVAMLAVAGSTVGFGLAPALRSSDVDISEPLKDSAGTTTGRVRHRYSGLVVAEVALSLVLLMGAGLLIRAVRHIQTFDFGYDARGLVQAWIGRGRTPDSLVAQRFALVASATRHAPGALALASQTVQETPGGGVESENTGRGPRLLNKHYLKIVSPEFLWTLGIPLVDGRDFEAGDQTGRGAVIVDQDAAAHLWGEASPVGQMIRLGAGRSEAEWLPVVGVARNARLAFESDPDLPPEPEVYVVPRAAAWRGGRLIVRVAGDAGRAGLALHRVVREAMPDARAAPMFVPYLYEFDTMVRAREFVVAVFAVLGACGLALAAVGLYGVLGYSVGRRMREFAVRIALGAGRRELLALVARDAAAMVLAGTGIGALAAMWAGSLLSAFLYDVQPADVKALLGAEALLLVVAFLACLAPALRATRADPLEILRAS